MLRLFRLPARIPLRLPESQASQKWLAAGVIAALATLIAVAWRHTMFISAPMGKLDDVLYDSMYELRTPQDRTNGPVVIVAVDQHSLTELSEGKLYDQQLPWPWPRVLYADMVEYLAAAGARVIAFDMIFSEPDQRAAYGSDETFAEVVTETTQNTPTRVIFGTQVNSDGKPRPFAIPIQNPTLGAVNSEGGVHRYYEPIVFGFPSLAFQAATLYTGREPAHRDRYLAHFYGPHRTASGATTFRYVPAFDVLVAAQEDGPKIDLDPELFRDKIVLIGGIAAGMGDMKLIPLRNRLPGVPKNAYPGVEWQATAIANLLSHQHVVGVHPVIAAVVTFIGAMFAATGSLLPRQVLLKLSAALLASAVMVAIAILLFRGETIHWLPLAAPLTAILLATVGGFAWSYFTEDRQRRLILNALSQSISPHLAEQIARDPSKLKLGGERREMTVMFTDVAGFTDMSEKLQPEKLAELMNYYLEEMSSIVIGADGYLDKYIGDAIMSFWNAPIDQPEHAILACRTALGMARREKEIQEELRRLGATGLLTRIGLNTGPMAVGNLGSSRKFSYTVLGDSVNLGARLEGANKLYGSQILMAQTTADRVKEQFVARELDLLRVKGKLQPMAVYELMAEGKANGDLVPRIEIYAEALAHYRAQRWDAAEAAFRRLLNEFPDDCPAAKMLARIPDLRAANLPADWDGVYIATGK